MEGVLAVGGLSTLKTYSMMLELPGSVDDKVKETVRVVLVLAHVTPEETFALPLKLRLQLMAEDP